MHPRIASQSNNFDWPGGLCPSRSCVSCEVIYCSLELDARFRCPTFPRFLPTPVTKRYFHLSILSFSFLFYLSLSLSFSVLLPSPSFSPSSPWRITRYRQQTVTQERKIFSGGENCPELVTENTSKHRWRGEERRKEDGTRRDEEFSLVMQQRRNLHTAKYIIKRSTSSFSSSVPENVSDLRFLLVWSAEIPGYTILDKVHFTIVAHK